MTNLTYNGVKFLLEPGGDFTDKGAFFFRKDQFYLSVVEGNDVRCGRPFPSEQAARQWAMVYAMMRSKPKRITQEDIMPPSV